MMISATASHTPRTRKRFLTTVAIALVVGLAFPAVVFASSWQWVDPDKISPKVDSITGVLEVGGGDEPVGVPDEPVKILVGAGDNETTTITASAEASALYVCRSDGGNFPSAPKKEEVFGQVSVSDLVTSDKNGNIAAAFTLEPPPSTLECPPGQHVVLVGVSYTNVYLSEPHAGTLSIPGTFELTFFDL